LTLGVLDVSSSNAAFDSFGGSAFDTSVSGDHAVRALVRYYNGHGGIAGRHIRLVEYVLNATDDYASDYQAACAKFTQLQSH
jgi:hypothetical protein